MFSVSQFAIMNMGGWDLPFAVILKLWTSVKSITTEAQTFLPIGPFALCADCGYGRMDFDPSDPELYYRLEQLLWMGFLSKRTIGRDNHLYVSGPFVKTAQRRLNNNSMVRMAR